MSPLSSVTTACFPVEQASHHRAIYLIPRPATATVMFTLVAYILSTSTPPNAAPSSSSTCTTPQKGADTQTKTPASPSDHSSPSSPSSPNPAESAKTAKEQALASDFFYIGQYVRL